MYDSSIMALVVEVKKVAEVAGIAALAEYTARVAFPAAKKLGMTVEQLMMVATIQFCKDLKSQDN